LGKSKPIGVGFGFTVDAAWNVDPLDATKVVFQCSM